MPLTRRTILAYDVTAMTFGFTMTDQRGRTVLCSISGAAMDELDDRSKGKGTLPRDRRAQFEVLRDKIETIASKLFDQDSLGRDTVQIYYHHAWSRKYRAVTPGRDAVTAPPLIPGATVANDVALQQPPGNKRGLDRP